MSSKALLKKIVSLADDKKAENIVALDVSNITSLSEYFVVCSASNLIQVKAIADNIKESEDLKKEIIEYCRSKIAHYKCPKSVDFVSSLPRSETGKLLKRYI